MDEWPIIPDDAVDWFRIAFSEANRVTTERLDNVPNIRETTLDDTLIDALIDYSAPRQLGSGAIVRMEIHNIGGLRRVSRWETADIAVLVSVHRGGGLVAQKIGLLQSKRLYPERGHVDDEDAFEFQLGMNRFLYPEPKLALSSLRTSFRFSRRSRYQALTKSTDQIDQIARFNSRLSDAIYYLFFNPSAVPLAVEYPLTARRRIDTPTLGCRVYKAATIEEAVNRLRGTQGPMLQTLEAAGQSSNWRLEHWAADLLLKCKVGARLDSNSFELADSILYRRSGPIGAAVSASIHLPADR